MLKLFKNLRIRTQLIISFSLLILLAVIAVYVGANDVFNKNFEDLVKTEVECSRSDFDTIKERDTKILSSSLEIIIQAPAIKEIYLEKDREKLVKQYQQLQVQLTRTEGAIAYISDNLKALEEEDAGQSDNSKGRVSADIEKGEIRFNNLDELYMIPYGSNVLFIGVVADGVKTIMRGLQTFNIFQQRKR